MPTDDILDHFDWEEEAAADRKLDELLEQAFTPDVETVRIQRYAFSWQAELAKAILRNQQIPSFVTNSLTSNILHLEWAQVDLYVRTEDAEQALAILETNNNQEESEEI